MFFFSSWSRPFSSGRLVQLGFGALALLAASLVPARAAADRLIINQPGAHPRYAFEAEPHLVLGFVDPPRRFGGRGEGFGPGFRGTLILVDNGFVSSINNSVGLGFGADVLLAGGDGVTVVLPVVMQWNFWLSENWSVFGEPGGAIYLGEESGVGPVLMAGGRFHFSDDIALTMRVGYPSLAVGVSFLL